MEETADRIPWAQQTINKRFYLGPGIHPSIVSSIVFSLLSSYLLFPIFKWKRRNWEVVQTMRKRKVGPTLMWPRTTFLSSSMIVWTEETNWWAPKLSLWATHRWVSSFSSLFMSFGHRRRREERRNLWTEIYSWSELKSRPRWFLLPRLLLTVLFLFFFFLLKRRRKEKQRSMETAWHLFFILFNFKLEGIERRGGPK